MRMGIGALSVKLQNQSFLPLYVSHGVFNESVRHIQTPGVGAKSILLIDKALVEAPPPFRVSLCLELLRQAQ